MKAQRLGRLLKRSWDWGKPILVVVVVVTSLRSAVADWNDVPTGSMKPTILEGDRIFVNKLAYDLKVPYTTWRLAQWGDPERGDVVICYSPTDGKRLVKRVVGLPGDRIEMRANQLTINSAPLDYVPLAEAVRHQIDAAERPHRLFATEQLGSRSHAVMTTPAARVPRSFEPMTVPADHYFVMGDNRDESFDSRRFGCVPRNEIVGRAVRVVLSLDPHSYYLPRWDRFFHQLP